MVLLRSCDIAQRLSSFLGYTEDHERRILDCGTAVGMLFMASCVRGTLNCEYITYPSVRSTPGLLGSRNPDPRMKNIFAVFAVLSAQLVAAHCA